MPSIIRKLTQHFSRSSQSGETLKTTPIRGLSGRFYSNPTQKNPPDKELASIKLSLQKKSKHNVDDDDVALLAKILSHPLALPPTGPASMKLSKLSDTHLKSLALKYNDLSDARNNILANKHEALSKSLEFPTLINLTELIQVNSISGRPVEAQLAFDHIIEIGLIPDVVAYNNLLNAYAAGHNIEQMDRVLGEMRKSSLEFDIVTFSILIKCYSQTNRVEEAFEVLGI
jgi:pentatricopeptide repeat protein